MASARSPSIEFYFDCSSPWTYLAFHGIQAIAARFSAEIVWKPIVVGGVFNKVNQAVYAARDGVPPAKLAYTVKDLQDWARLRGVVLKFPPACGHPINSVKCMRGCIALAEENLLVPFATLAFQALWVEGRDLGLDEVLGELCRLVGGDEEAFLRAIVSPELKQKLRVSTDELIERGGFGSPTIFLGEDMYFGNDRLQLVEQKLAGLAAYRS
jgi:2-hydroxychromene-2-carboxylate isomerase